MALRWCLQCRLKTFLSCFVFIFFMIFILVVQDLMQTSHVAVADDYHEAGRRGEAAALQEDIQVPIIVWWTGFTADPGSTKTCGPVSCFFTIDKHYKEHPSTQAFMFYGSDFKMGDLPVPRRAHHQWALLHEESPKNIYLFSHEDAMVLFNHTSTFRRQSDYPITTQHLNSMEELESGKYWVPTKEKTRAHVVDGLALVNYVQSDCDAPSDRDHFVQMLQRHIKVDSYGACEHNKDLPQHLTDPLKGMDHEEFYRLTAQYKFTLAMENAACDDYITEKFWRPLIVASVPIVFGSSKAKYFLPSDHSAIHLDEFTDVKDLVNLILYLNKTDSKYESYLDFKRTGVTNQKLREIMLQRRWGINDDSRPNFIDSFECFVCKRIHENMERKRAGLPPLKFEAREDHYGCPKPLRFSDWPRGSLERKDASWWAEEWTNSKYQAAALRALVEQGSTFNAKDIINKASLLRYKNEY